MILIEKELISFLPDIHIINLRFPVGLKFIKQLFLNRHIKKYNDFYIELNKLPIPIFIPKMLSYYNIDVDYQIAEKLWMTVLDTWYARLDVNNVSLESLCELTDGILKSVFDFVKI